MSIETTVDHPIPDSARPGPNTEAGKAISSQNALKDGLFTAEDFILPGEEDEYFEARQALEEDLCPIEPSLQIWFDEIVSASWRLRRCRRIEAHLATRADEFFLLSPEDEARQKSVDRARSQSVHVLKKAFAEYRRIKTDCVIHSEYGWEETHQMDHKRVLAAFQAKRKDDALQIKEQKQANWEQIENYINGGPAPDFLPIPANADSFCKKAPAAAEAPNQAKAEPKTEGDSFCKTAPAAPEAPNQAKTEPKSEGDSFCKTAPSASKAAPKPGRNERCPCGSGLKFKRCCLNQPVEEPKIAA